MLNFVAARFSASQTCKRRTQLGFLLCNASHIFLSFSSLVESSKSNQPKQKLEGNESLTVSYLMNSCGLSAKVALEVSQRVNLKFHCKPDLVINHFRSHGFSEIQISKIVKSNPLVLSANPEKIILPKLKFFQSLGFSCSELQELLVSNPALLNWSLEKRLIPLYESLKSILDDDEKVCVALRRLRWFSVRGDVTNLVPNIEVLRDLGVPQSAVFLLLTSWPLIAFMNPAKFVECVKFAKEAGIEPFKVAFVQAITVLAHLKKSNWESKLDFFQRFGWSRNLTLTAFSKFPNYMLLSEENITNKIKFFADETSLSSEDIACCPSILSYSLKQRVVPRWSVIKVLKIKGLVSNKLSLKSILVISEKKFRENYVIRFQGIVPELLKIYEEELRPLSQVQS